MTTRLRVLFLGTDSSFSLPPLLALLGAPVDVVGIVVPGTRAGLLNLPLREQRPPRSLPMLHQAPSQGIVSAGWNRGVPVLEVGRLDHPNVVRAIAAFSPDFICVACFPRRLPRAVLDLPPCGCLNVHPSLLPENRGPAPLFWTFRSGATFTGVSVHLMTDELDRGDIIIHDRQEVPEGISGAELDRQCAVLGGRLLVQAVHDIWAGTATRRVQQPGEGNYQGWPRACDFEVRTSWSAERAFRFVRGVDEWGTRPVILVEDQRFSVGYAAGYRRTDRLPCPYVWAGRELHVQFSPGVLSVRASGGH